MGDADMTWQFWIVDNFMKSLQTPKVNLREIAATHADPYRRALAKAALEFFAALEAGQDV